MSRPALLRGGRGGGRRLLFTVDVAHQELGRGPSCGGAGPARYLGGHLVLRYQTNTGIAFGLFQPHLHPHKRLWLIGYGAAVSVALAGVLAWQVLRPAGRRLAPDRRRADGHAGGRDRQPARPGRRAGR